LTGRSPPKNRRSGNPLHPQIGIVPLLASCVGGRESTLQRSLRLQHAKASAQVLLDLLHCAPCFPLLPPSPANLFLPRNTYWRKAIRAPFCFDSGERGGSQIDDTK